MPSRSLPRAALAVLATLAVVAGAAVVAPAARATVVVVDRAGHVLATPVGEDRDDALLGWTAAGLVVRAPGDQALLVDPSSGARTPLGPRPAITSLGPDGSWIALSGIPRDYAHFAATLHAPDGRAWPAVSVAATSLDDLARLGTVAWSADGRRAAVALDEETAVLDVATGAVVRRVPTDELTAEALSPDGTRLTVTRDLAVRQVDLASGAETVLLPATKEFQGIPWSFWSPGGRLALLAGGRARLTDPAQTIAMSDVHVLGWAPDGAGLAAVRDENGRVVDGCYLQFSRVDLYTPGGPAPLLPITAGQVRGLRWSPDGTRAAVDLRALVDPALQVRGTRHAWPKRLPKSYDMDTGRGERAVRRALVRFVSDLRGGMGRQPALTRLRHALDAVWHQPWGRPFQDVMDSPTYDVITGAVDRWLRAAGFAPVEDVFSLGCPRIDF